MLTDAEREALTWWYSQDEVLQQARDLARKKAHEELEEYLHRSVLLPLSNREALPDAMRDEDGAPIFPTHLDPRADEAKWQDAIELGWDVVQKELSISRDDIHRSIATEQEKDWEAFMESIERRKRERS